jgi:hypothetical protein
MSEEDNNNNFDDNFDEEFDDEDEDEFGDEDEGAKLYLTLRTPQTWELHQVKISHVSIMNWVRKYTQLMKEYVDKLIREYQEVWSVGRWNDAYVKGTEPMGKVTTAGCGQLWLQLKNLECTSNKRLLHYTLKSFFYLYL